MTITLHPGDNIKSMRAMAPNSVDSIVCDPPYLLTSIVKRFGAKDSAPANTDKNDGSFARLSGGFMGRKWDSPNVDLPTIDADFANYMAGLIDGEGCFSVHKKNVSGYETYDCQFSITMRSDDADILREMQRRLDGIGSIAIRDRTSSNPQVRYCISSKKDCCVLREVLMAFPLRAKKARDFEIWCHALDAWLAHEPGGTWEDMSYYRDQIMLIKRFGSYFNSDLLFHYRWAKEAIRVLKPGGYIVAFSSSRTFARMAVAIEDAGFITHPMIGWVYGQGFPKAHAADKAIDKAIDKMLGRQGDVVPAGDPVKRMIPGADQNKAGWEKNNGREYQPGSYVPATDEAAEWQGWAYGGQVRKPALEPIYVGQKPFSEKTGAANILKWGVGAVNIDGCRVPIDQQADASQIRTMQRNQRIDDLNGQEWGMSKSGGDFPQVIRPEGRHPANLIHDGSAEVVALFPESNGQNGDLKGHGTSRQSPNGIFGGMRPALDHPKRGDSGSAARFFESYPFDGEPLFYRPKAGKEDRAGSRHPTVKPIALMQALMRHVTPPGGTVLDPFAGSGTTAEAARREGFDCILMEAEPEYVEFLQKRFGQQEMLSPAALGLLRLLGFSHLA